MIFDSSNDLIWNLSVIQEMYYIFLKYAENQTKIRFPGWFSKKRMLRAKA